MFELRGVSKAFGETQALHQIDLTVVTEKTTVLIGQSGCGKSTLIRLLVGLVLPDTGSILFEGETLTLQNAEMLRRKMGYVIQEGGLFPHLTARENVCLMANYLRGNESKGDQIETGIQRDHRPGIYRPIPFDELEVGRARAVVQLDPRLSEGVGVA